MESNVKVEKSHISEFKKDYMVIELEKIYPDWDGTEKYAIRSDVTEELSSKYSDVLPLFSPYIKLDKEIINEILKAERAEHANNEKERSHCLSIDAFAYEGTEIGIEDNYEEEIYSARTRNALSKIKPVTVERLEKLAGGKGYQEIADEEGKAVSSVFESIERAKIKFSENF